MHILITDNHNGEGVFPVFTKGTTVENLEPCEEYEHWLACTINGVATFIPDVYIDSNKLTRDYNPTELVVKKDEVVELVEIAYEWLYVKNKDNDNGWIPANKAITLSK